MKYWYQHPIQSLSEYVRTVLVLEGFRQQIQAFMAMRKLNIKQIVQASLSRSVIQLAIIM